MISRLRCSVFIFGAWWYREWPGVHLCLFGLLALPG